MKYFAKYLPVEGEIKEGDKTMESNGNILPHTISKDEIAFAKSQGDKVVKLFLCSRYVTSEDYQLPFNLPEDYLQKEYSRYAEGDLTFDQWFNGSIKWIESIGAFKVIGEISPDATFVKEGDEFDEDDVSSAFGYIDGEPFENYQIKSSCGHFH